MYLKRIFTDGQPDTVRVLRMSKRWHPSSRIITRGQREGWLSIRKDLLTLHAPVGEVDTQFNILALPDIEEKRLHYICEAVA